MAISTYSVTWRLDVKNILDNLADFAGLTPTDGVFIVGDGANWVAESGATVRASLGLGTAAVENIGTSGANVPLMSTANTWSADQKISATTAIFILNETDGTSTHNSTWFAQASNQLFIQTRSNSGTLVSSDYILAKGASGVTSHDWRINGTQKLILNSTGLTVTDALTVNGSGNLGNISGLTLASGDIIYANATPALTNLAKGTDGQVLTLASGLPSWANAASNDWTYASRQTAGGETALDFSSIPDATEIELIAHSLSLSGTDNIVFQVGASGTPSTSGYTGLEFNIITTTISRSAISSGFIVRPQSALRCFTGTVRLTKNTNGGTNHWECWVHGVDDENDQCLFHCFGYITLAGALDIFRVTRSGTNTIAQGTLDLRYK